MELPNTLIGVSVTIILALVVLGTIFSFMATSIDVQTSTNETLALSGSGANRSGTLPNTNTVSITAIRNVSGVNCKNNCTTTTASGFINCSTLCVGTGNIYVDYSYKPTSYIESSMTRTILNYSPLLLAVLLFIFVAGYVVARKE